MRFTSRNSGPKFLSRIGIVDDQASILDALKLVLEDLGHQAECFSSGRQLFNHLADQTLDLLILDPHLSGMDGYEILTKLDTYIPTVLLTAWPHAPLVTKLKQHGALDVMVKPVSAQKLKQIIATHLIER